MKKKPKKRRCVVCGFWFFRDPRSNSVCCSPECKKERNRKVAKGRRASSLNKLQTYKSGMKIQWKNQPTEFLIRRYYQSLIRAEVSDNLLAERGVDIEKLENVEIGKQPAKDKKPKKEEAGNTNRDCQISWREPLHDFCHTALSLQKAEG